MSQSLADTYAEEIRVPVQKVVDVGMVVAEPAVNFLHWLNDIADYFSRGTNSDTTVSTPAETKIHYHKALYGLVDMGSNGIRFSISDLSPPTSRLLHCIYRERAGISLYDALHESEQGSDPPKFSEQTITKVADTMQRFKSICDGTGVKEENILVFATEAMRTAGNKDDMLNAIEKKSGWSVNILQPKMESLFGAMGARSGFSNVDGLFMDLGGGSVQMTYMDSESGEGYPMQACQAATSLPYGAARLTGALKAKDTADAAEKDLQQKMKASFEGLRERFPKLKEQTTRGTDGVTIYFCGGGFRGYGSMLMHTDDIQPYPIPAIGGYTVPGCKFIQWRKMLEANSDPGKIYGMSKRRREQFPAIVTVVRSIIEAIPYIKQVIFCSGGNREGVLYMRLPSSIRQRSPLVVLPGGILPEVTNLQETLKTIVPLGAPHADAFDYDMLYYIAKHMYAHLGDADDVNSTKYLHTPISGHLAGLPGFTHQTRALFALTMCARWNSDLGRVDRELFSNLQRLIGSELSFLCDYIGTAARLIATIVPTIPKPDSIIPLKFNSKFSHTLGKKGKSNGIFLRLEVERSLVAEAHKAIDEDFFKRVGKGLHLDWKLKIDVE